MKVSGKRLYTLRPEPLFVPLNEWEKKTEVLPESG